MSASLVGNRADYKIVADYLRELDYDHAFISSSDGHCFYGLKFHFIESDEVRTSIKTFGAMDVSVYAKMPRMAIKRFGSSYGIVPEDLWIVDSLVL